MKRNISNNLTENTFKTEYQQKKDAVGRALIVLFVAFAAFIAIGAVIIH